MTVVALRNYDYLETTLYQGKMYDVYYDNDKTCYYIDADGKKLYLDKDYQVPETTSYKGQIYDVCYDDKRRCCYINVNGKKLYLNKNYKVSGKQFGKSSKTGAFESFEDMGKVLSYLKNLPINGHLYYLLFVINCNIARRIGDVLKLKWSDFFLADGNFRDKVEIPDGEQKTGKCSRIHINQSVKEAFRYFLSVESIDLQEEYEKRIFIHRKGKREGEVWTKTQYYKVLKKAQADCDIPYDISSHSCRRGFGKLSMDLHPTDPTSTNTLMEIYKHSSPSNTNRYIGLTDKKIDGWFDNFGEAFTRYAVQGEFIPMNIKSPIISLPLTMLRDVISKAIKAAFQAGMNAGNGKQEGDECFKILNEALQNIETIINMN